jgi:hypothetical protein
VSSKLYLVPWTVQKFAGDICWGDACGKGQCGAVSIDVGPGMTVECIPCREDDCPFAERTMDEPCGEVQGESVYLRKLREEPAPKGDAK